MRQAHAQATPPPQPSPASGGGSTLCPWRRPPSTSSAITLCRIAELPPAPAKGTFRLQGRAERQYVPDHGVVAARGLDAQAHLSRPHLPTAFAPVIMGVALARYDGVFAAGLAFGV